MNLYFVLLLIVSAVNCAKDIDWRNVKSRQNLIIVPKSNNTSLPTYRKPSSRILNGQDVTNIQEFSYQVGLLLEDKNRLKFWCGGSIINNIWILTAAHCLFDTESAKIYLGAINKNNPEKGSQIIDVKKDNFIIHESYNTDEVYNDIGLIKLNTALEFTDSIRSIDLLTSEEGKNIDGTTALISGWGIMSDNKGAATKLQYTRTKLWSNKDCEAKFKTFPKPINAVKTDNSICADPSDTTGICDGDSGGPVVELFQGRRVQVGINSFIISAGNSCNSAIARVFLRLSNYIDWIYKNTKICNK